MITYILNAWEIEGKTIFDEVKVDFKSDKDAIEFAKKLREICDNGYILKSDNDDVTWFFDPTTGQKQFDTKDLFKCDCCEKYFSEEEITDDRPSDFSAIRCSKCYGEGE